MQETIDLYASGGQAGPLEAVKIDRGKLTMDAIRDVISEMEAEESRLLQERQRKSERDSQFFTQLGTFGAFTAFL